MEVACPPLEGSDEESSYQNRCREPKVMYYQLFRFFTPSDSAQNDNVLIPYDRSDYSLSLGMIRILECAYSALNSLNNQVLAS